MPNDCMFRSAILLIGGKEIRYWIVEGDTEGGTLNHLKAEQMKKI